MKNLLFPPAYFIIGFGLTFILFFFIPLWPLLILSIIVGIWLFSIGKSSLVNVDEQKYTLHILFGKYNGILEPGLQHVIFGFVYGTIIEYSKEVFTSNFVFETKHNSKDKLFLYSMNFNILATFEIENPKKFYLKTGLKSFEPKNINSFQNSWLKNINKEIEIVFRQIAFKTSYPNMIENPNWTTVRIDRYLLDSNEKNTLTETLNDYGIRLNAINLDIDLEESAKQIIKEQFIAKEEHSVRTQRASTDAEVKSIKDRKIASITMEIIDSFMSKGISNNVSIELANILMKNYDNTTLIKLSDTNGKSLQNEIDKLASIWLTKS